MWRNRDDAAKLLDETLEAGQKKLAKFADDGADEYLQGAQDVMQNGYKVEYMYKGEIRTGYV